jgi:hypothetical protein
MPGPVIPNDSRLRRCSALDVDELVAAILRHIPEEAKASVLDGLNRELGSGVRISDPAVFQRQPGESPAAFAAFLCYRDLGPGRSVVEAYRQRTGKGSAKQASGEWNAWAVRFGWAERAAAHDAHMEAIRQRAREAEAAAEAAKWERRRQEEVEAAWEAGESLRAKARAMLEFPVADEQVARTEDGWTVTLRKPARWAFRDVGALLKIAAELKAAAVRAATQDISELSDTERGGIASVDYPGQGEAGRPAVAP